jgi:cellulase
MLSSLSRLSATVAATLLTLNLVAAHSHINYVIVNGLLYQGFNPHIPNNPDNVIGWSTTASDDGFVPPSNYSSTDIICHRDGKPAKAHVPIKAGDKMHIQWNGWPLSHHGPVLSYLAPCSGADGCASVDKTKLSFSKIDNSSPALVSESGGPPGSWATDVLIASNNSWLLEIPPTLEPGPYVLRHEIVALHYANQPDGAQNYPQCMNLWVMPANTSAVGGSSVLALGQGVAATKLYKASDPGVDIDIYKNLTTYVIPGPTVVSGAAPVALTKQALSRSTADGTPVSVTASKTAPFANVKATKAARRDHGDYLRAVPRRGLA